jgi:hypothetical protein
MTPTRTSDLVKILQFFSQFSLHHGFLHEVQLIDHLEAITTSSDSKAAIKPASDQFLSYIDLIDGVCKSMIGNNHNICLYGTNTHAYYFVEELSLFEDRHFELLLMILWRTSPKTMLKEWSGYCHPDEQKIRPHTCEYKFTYHFLRASATEDTKESFAPPFLEEVQNF